jgi:hypothetical protein
MFGNTSILIAGPKLVAWLYRLVLTWHGRRSCFELVQYQDTEISHTTVPQPHLSPNHFVKHTTPPND